MFPAQNTAGLSGALQYMAWIALWIAADDRDLSA
jgi:hypothetical protein